MSWWGDKLLMVNNHSKLSKEELLKVIQKIKSRKKYGLIWDEERIKEKFEKESENALPVLKEIKNKEIKTDPAKPVNILIEGDNYHALSVLNYTHQGGVDIIYIDPPYNTGNKDFKFNDTYVDKDDTYRHSKWLSFMSKRLRLAKNLLKNTGAIFISIDNNELAQLKILCDEIFGEDNLIGLVSVAKGTTTGQDAKKFGSSADYLLVYGMINFIVGRIELSEKDKKRFSRKDKKGLYSILQWRKTGNGDHRKDRPNLYYPLKAPNGKKVFPKGPTGYDSRWRGDLKRFKKLKSEGMVEWVKQDNGWRPYIKYYLEGRMKAPSNLWTDLEGNKKATIELKEIFGEKVFQNPKPTDLIKRCIQLANISDPIVLDFFVGSGTTAQAVLDLNYQDDGNRQFIACTNNENNICAEICYPRIKKVITGYKNPNGLLIDGTGNNLKYFKTAFVKRSISKDNLKIRITQECTEMLCLREGIFNELKKTDDYRIFQYNGRIMAVYYSLERGELKSLKRDLDKIKGKKILYCFTLDPLGLDRDDFHDWKGISLEPIPQKILDIYEGIYEY
ncbi:MAG: site-specific DNA-methyltransferase [Candidatus Omnitrophica bacterium]|nr:site-specific DNA-methyltransferase [Candidatus Omnitrophota bacterium]